jgi:hypothetical protein
VTASMPSMVVVLFAVLLVFLSVVGLFALVVGMAVRRSVVVQNRRLVRWDFPFNAHGNSVRLNCSRRH